MATLLAALAAGAIFAAAGLSKPAVAAPAIDAAPPGSTSQSSASFAFSDSQAGVTFTCSLDNAAFAACASPKAYAGLAAGRHIFQVKAVSGSQQSSATSYTWTVDLTPPPAPSITATPANPTSQTVAGLSFGDSEPGVTFQCKLDGGGFGACASPKAYAGLAPGQHGFSVRALDAAGNASGATSYTWTVDTTPPPAPQITARPADPTTASDGASATFSLTDGEAGAHFSCRLDGGSYEPCASPQGYGDIGQGAHTFGVIAIDAAGNESAATTYGWTIVHPVDNFTLDGDAVGLLSPGAWRPIAVTVANPSNNFAIALTDLTASAAADSTPSGCATGANLEFRQSNVSASNALAVPAHGSVTLPAQGVSAPQVRLRDLPTVNQDSCKGKSFSFHYTGTATK